MTPAEVEDELLRLVDRLEEATLEMGALAQSAGESEVAAKVAYARAFLQADGPVATREAIATVETAEQALARRIAEAKHQSQRELLNTIRTQVDALRTIAANLRNLT